MERTDDGEEEPGEVEPPELDPQGQLFELLNAPDRDRCPGARPVVSVDEGDDPAFLEEVDAHCVAAPTLTRRGRFHGNWAELDDSLAFVPRDPLAVLGERFGEARPIVLHDALPDDVLVPAPTAERREGLSAPGGLEEFLEARAAHLEPEFRVLGSATDSGGGPMDERDVAKVRVAWREPDASRPSRNVDDLWVKSQRLSTYADDLSLRMRVSFGREVDDDASDDTFRHRLVARLAERLIPELRPLHADPELRGLVGEWIRARPLFTQSIAYWNAPNGGALFHHDAFAGDSERGSGQRGVLYAQVTGSTAWLALSQADLAERIVEFGELLEDESLSHVDAVLERHLENYEALRALMANRSELERELSLPGCGRVGPIVNFGPEFTSLLADAGHSFVLDPGDVVILPNHGYGKTCMHSVFCASSEPAFSLSMAIRASGRPKSAPDRDTRSGRPRRRRGSRRRGRPGSRRRR